MVRRKSRSEFLTNQFSLPLVQFDWTALHLACDGGHTGVVDALLDAKADVEALTQVSRSPFILP